MSKRRDTTSISATNLAQYHHFRCDLYLGNVAHQSSAGSGHPRKPPDEVSKAQFKRGMEWESNLLAWLSREGLLLTILSTPLVAADLIENLSMDERDHFFIAGLCFYPPEKELRARYAEAGCAPVKFGLAKPDLLEIKRTNEGVTWRVIDAKASSAVKTSHHVQIYFYTLCLSYMLRPPYFKPADTAGVWLPPSDPALSTLPSFEDLKETSIAILQPSLDAFLFRRLPKILSRPVRDLPWHFGPSCRGCPFTDSCRERAIEGGEIGSMGNITLEDVRVLRDLLRLSRQDPDAEKVGLTDIEDLDNLLHEPHLCGNISKSSPLTMKKAKRILSISAQGGPHQSVPLYSPLIEAAKTDRVQIIPQRNYMLPSIEDIAVVVTLLQDLSTPGQEIVSYCISTFYRTPNMGKTQILHGSGPKLVASLASVIRRCSSPPAKPRTQFYVFNTAEHTALQSHLIQAALTSENTDDVRICIGALSQGAALLRTSFQPLVLSGALLEFLSKQRTKAELQTCLQRLELSMDGTVPILRERIRDFVRQNQDSDQQNASQERRRKLGQLPRVVVLRREIERLFALPIAGFWDLPECAAMLCENTGQTSGCPSDTELYDAYVFGKSLERLMTQRNSTIFAVLKAIRSRILYSELGLLVNEGKPLSANFMDICKVEPLRKLFFMMQFEVLAKLTELWKARIDGCPEAPVIQYISTTQRGNDIEHVFSIVSGSIDKQGIDKEKQRSFYDFLLAKDDSTAPDGSLPPEVLFDDLGVSGLVFPLNRYTKARWDEQDPLVRQRLLLADIRDIFLDGLTKKVVLRTWGGVGMKLLAGQQYRLSPRLVDFNITKVLSTLVELDFRCIGQGETPPIPFLQIIQNPKSLADGEFADPTGTKKLKKDSARIQRLFRELMGLNVDGANYLVLMNSQNKAAHRILFHRLSVVWGPPGTGKTHTIALSILRLLELSYNPDEPSGKIIFLTAMTHAAIEACLKKLSHLIACYRAIDGLPTQWLDALHIEHVAQGSSHGGPAVEADSYIYAGTVYQLYNFSKKQSFEVDCVVIDEAGQLSLTSSALVLRSLSATGKIIVAGDSEQLAPILTAQYPQLKTGSLFGSVLDCLMFWSSINDVKFVQDPDSQLTEDEPGSQQTVVQLTENFRLNEDLGDFVATIYSRAFKPQKSQTRELARALKTISQDFEQPFSIPPEVVEQVQWFLLGLSDAMLRQPQSILKPPTISTSSEKRDKSHNSHLSISLALIRLQTSNGPGPERVSYEVHVKGEAAVAAALVLSLRRACPEDDIFVATPHRIQRQAVKAALDKIEDTRDLATALDAMDIDDEYPPKRGIVTVDTVERLQGSEAAFVICLFSLPGQASPSELGFLLERRRLNVAISRAKTLCILIASPEVLCPSINVLADPNSAKGFTFLKAFEERSWSASINVEVEHL